ncbi:hypothetical protein [Tengunoibacter tsumagoiensis]|uniref:Uncharacterized protein n=1 Tax=Tengunoibacter tsumagoiensis TaxID=2014871 RepID=A0A402A7V4_9CHLR|nr:hypothetical protein [Tengunoibacter tsumagoiensis]GCE15061.1 hypothetical protein KTT_49200 [Tengunoibacter tsumagoiensis]
MKYGTLSTLNSILKDLQSDAATLGLTIAGLMIIVSVIMIMFTDDTNVSSYNKRWDNLRKVFLCAALIAAAGAIVTFGQQIGGALHG